MTSRIAWAVALCSLAYGAGAIAALLAFRKRPQARPEATPFVTTFKPIRGLEPRLSRDLASFCDQDYPRHRVVFCMRDLDDAAFPIALDLLRDRPTQDLLLVVDPRASAKNPKVANIANAIDFAAGELLVIADSDIGVDTHCLRSIAAPFSQPDVGAVSCLYRGRPSSTLASRIDALIVDDHFAPSVLVAAALSPVDFCLGACMAVRRQALADIGGIRALGPHLADDHKLGKLVAGRGWRVALSSYVVSASIAHADLRELWTHQLREARTVKAVQPTGYAFSFIQYTLPVTVIAACFLKSWRSASILTSLAALLRVAVHYASARALRQTREGSLALIPLCDALSLAAWAASFFGRTISWRGERFRLGDGDALEP